MFMSKLKLLQELDLSSNQLSDVRLNTYLPKPELQLLNLSNNAIRYVEGLEVAGPNLRELYLHNNELYSLKGIYSEVVQLTKL
jgi:Leucine-rich repeat (LRR) protein